MPRKSSRSMRVNPLAGRHGRGHANGLGSKFAIIAADFWLCERGGCGHGHEALRPRQPRYANGKSHVSKAHQAMSPGAKRAAVQSVAVPAHGSLQTGKAPMSRWWPGPSIEQRRFGNQARQARENT